MSNPRINRRLPNYRVFTRLRPSKLHGVGVFAIGRIKKGSSIFYGDDEDFVWIPRSKVAKLPKEIRRFYDDFCILKGDEYGCPRNFNLMTIAWYLNHSARPNVRCNDDFRFVALRDIRRGEELTVDYRTFSEGIIPTSKG